MLKIIIQTGVFTGVISGAIGCGAMILDEYKELNKTYWTIHSNDKLKLLLKHHYEIDCAENRNEKARLQIIKEIIQNNNEKTALDMYQNYREDIERDIFLSIPYYLRQKTKDMENVRKVCYSYLLHHKELETYMRLKFSR